MNAMHQTDNEQAALWNGPAGHAWVTAQELLDHLFKPFEDMLVEAVRTASGSHVLDVGCGTGSTTLAVARMLGTNGKSVGIDISNPMINLAKVRADQEGASASFVCADVQNYVFKPASFDTIISRFGVMFFSNPVTAFSNLRHAVQEGGELHVIAWRSAAENPFMTTTERAAAPLLPNIPARQPDAPGQFSFANRERISSILEDSGWSGIDIRPIDVECAMSEKDLVDYFTTLGPVGRLLQEVDEQTRTKVIETVRAAFEPYVFGTEVRFTAACWMVKARASSEVAMASK